MKKIISILFCLIFSFVLYAQSSASADDYSLTFFRKLDQTQKRLTYLNKKGSLEKVGTETINGLISGTLFYDVKVKGMGAVVTLRYTNFSDEDGWVFDGEIITYSNMAKNGHFEGTIKVSGKEPGEVCYDRVIMKKGEPGEGVYLISLPGKPAAEVDFSMYQKSNN